MPRPDRVEVFRIVATVAEEFNIAAEVWRAWLFESR
jgi:hypothetical protein